MTRLKRFLLTLMGMACSAHAAHAATLPSRQPGLWQSSTFVTLPNGTPMRGGNAIVTVSCVDALTDVKFFTFEGSSCTSLKLSGSGNSYSIDSRCTQQGQPVQIHTSLTYLDPQTIELIGTVHSPQGLVHLNAELKYQGDCLPGMVPGDEGDIESGAFVKTDNINDSGNQ